MNKNYFIFLLVLVTISFPACNQGKKKTSDSSKPSLEISTNAYFVIVRDGQTAKFYNGDLMHGMTKPNWNYDSAWSFNIPGKVDKLIDYWLFIGVQNGKTIQFYNKTINQLGWSYKPGYDFTIPNDADEVIGALEDIGVITGDTIRMYHYNEHYTSDTNDDEWVYDPKLDIVLVDKYKIDDIFFYRDDLCIRAGKNVTFYSRKDYWNHIEGSDFTVPGPCDQVLKFVTISDDFLGVRNGNKIKFYKKNKNSWDYDPRFDFNIPNTLNGI